MPTAIKQLSSKGEPKYVALAEWLRGEIETGGLKPGDRLPSFAEMRAAHNVSPTTIERVHHVLEGDGLIERRNGSGIYVAPAKKKAATGLIGFLASEAPQADQYGTHFYHAQLQEGARKAAKQHGLHLMLLDSDADEAALRRLDGVLVAPNVAPPSTRSLRVFLNHPGVEEPNVSVDEAGGVRAAVEHLVSLGHRRIAYLISAHEPYQTPRLRAYQKTLRENGIVPNPHWVRHLFEVWAFPTGFVGAANARMGQWLREDWKQLGCTALLCQNDQTALGALGALSEAGCKVPGDVSVVGFDGTEAADYSHPRLTTVQVPLHEVGTCGVEFLLRLINGVQDGSNMRTRVLPTKLRIGASTAPPSF